VLSLSLYPPHYPHITAFKQELSNWSFFYFEPRDRMRRSSPIKEVRHIGLMGEDLAAFLNTLRAVSPKQLQGIEKTLHAIIPSVSGIEVEPNDLGEVELRIVEGNTSIPASVVSEGTLRILGLLALNASTEPATLVGFEEPENGVHPRRIRLIAELLKSRSEQADTQLIVTTHSPILPDMLPNSDLYVCRKVEGETEIRPFSAWGELARDATIQKALDEEQISGVSIPVSQRILRGDFDA
jgi:predicted ATPase